MTNLLMVIQMLVAVGLIALVMMQTTKSEGLTGTIGGKASSTFRGKPGVDDQLANLTKWAAVGWMLMSFIVYVVYTKMGAG